MAYLLQQLLTASAARWPTQEAVRFRDERITYAELDRMTDLLARVLRVQGVERGDRVGFYLHKSIPSVLSMLSVLKAGAVYVPLDPHAPAARLRYIIENCGIRCLLSSHRKVPALREMFPQDSPLETVLLLDEAPRETGGNGGHAVPPVPARQCFDWTGIQAMPTEPLPELSLTEFDLAYILYTSGSTGTPKGVMISHRNALTFIDWAQEEFQVGPEDRLSNHAPMHFDLSIFDVFVGLKAGATICLVPEGTSTFPVKLAEWMAQNRISVWYSVPSILSMLVLHGQLDRQDLRELRCILFAGEVFPVKYLRQLQQLIPHAEYANLYGPTETNVCTCYRVPPLPPDRTEPAPIGKACANTEVFALNEAGQRITQPGEEGELLARGPCVAQGYWGDPDKTAQRFLRNPLQPHYEDRVYRTGDLVTLDQDGNWIYLGRRDHQIKSRGYRIELGDIETALYSHPDVKEAAVVAIPDDVVGNRIWAFVVPNGNQSLTPAHVEKHCLAKLPKYMVPERIEFRKVLPQTSTGKIDRPRLVQELVG